MWETPIEIGYAGPQFGPKMWEIGYLRPQVGPKMWETPIEIGYLRPKFTPKLWETPIEIGHLGPQAWPKMWESPLETGRARSAGAARAQRGSTAHAARAHPQDPPVEDTKDTI